MIRFPLTISIGLVALCANAADTRVATELVSDHAAVAPGDTFRVGVLFQIPPKSHIYWHNPGDTGLPTSVEFSVPEGFRVSGLQWPNPAAFYDDFLKDTSFGYEKETVLFITVHAPHTLTPGNTIPIHATASWLVCLEDGACIPEDAELDTSLSVSESSASSREANAIEAHAARVPTGVANNPVPLRVSIDGQLDPALHVIVDAPWTLDAKNAQFFPDSDGAWNRMPPSSPHEISFEPPQPIDQSATGALTLTVENPDTGERKEVFVRFGVPKGDG